MRGVFILICFIGCLFQITRISQIYFSYQTTADVKYEFDNMISLPGITVCFKKEFIMRKEKIIEKFAAFVNETSSSDHLLAYLNRMKIKEQLESTLSIEEVFDVSNFPIYTNDVLINEMR